MSSLNMSEFDNAFLSDGQIHRLMAGAYFQAGSNPECNMFLVAELFEKIRKDLFGFKYRPYKAWYDISLNRYKFDKEPYLSLVLNLKDNYYEETYKQIVSFLSEQFRNDPEAAFRYWLCLYGDAVCNYEEGIISMLFKEDIPYTAAQKTKIEGYRKFNAYFENYRDDEAFPFYKELADLDFLPVWLRSHLTEYLGDSLLNNIRAWESKRYFDEAAEIEVNPETLRGRGKYYQYMEQFERSKKEFQDAINTDPSDIATYLYMGDCFKKEGKHQMAEQWFEETININFLYLFSYQRLITLYGDWDAAQENRSKIPTLVEKAERSRGRYQAYELYEVYRAAGTAYSNFSEHGQAEKYYQQAIGLIPEKLNAKLDLAYAYGYQKKSAEAEGAFKSLLDSDPEHFEAGWGLAWVHEMTEAFDKAIAVYESLLKIKPGRADRMYNQLGRLFYLKGDLATAADYFRQAVAFYPYEPVYHENVLDMLDRQGNPGGDESEAILNKMVELFEGFPGFAGYVDNLGAFYENKGDEEKAEKYYLKAYEIRPDSGSLNRLGNFYYNQQDSARAIDYFSQAVKIKNDDPTLQENLGMAYQQATDFAAAEKAFLVALKLDPETARYLNRLGVLYYSQEKYEVALDYFLQAIGKQAEETILFNAVMAYQMLGRWADSLPVAERVVNLNPNENVNRLRLGFALYNTGSSAEALKIFLDLRPAYENDVTFLEYLGAALEITGDTEAAIALYTEKLGAYPNDAYLVWRLGILYQQKGGPENMEKAAAYFEQAMSKSPDSAGYRYSAAQLCKERGDIEGAKRHFEEAIAMDETNAYYRNEYGCVLYALEDFKSAVVHFKKATELSETTSLYFLNLGNAYQQLGEEQSATEAFEKARSLEAETEPAVNA